MLPRTRSGRVSKPPRHMVKDYKRLHHLDFAQPDLDDSDGGYSDYQISDAEDSNALDSAEDQEVKKDKTANIIPTSPFYCVTCKREYTTPHRYVIARLCTSKVHVSLFYKITVEKFL